MDARVIAAVGSDEKIDYLRHHGASDVINYRSSDLRSSVKSLTGGKGADVIFDPVGGDLFDQAMRCINWNGRLLVVGFASGKIPQLPVNLALLKGIAVVGVFYGRFEQEQPREAAENMAELAQLFEAGKIGPAIDQVYPLEQYAAAMNALTTRKVIGKVVVRI
jgi:NADPH2:quinone reductase